MCEKIEKKPLLSICIPTYNRKKELKALLDTLIQEFPDEELEVIINDNASTDDTKQEINEYLINYPQIKYFENDRNYGFDYNLNQTVLKSSGDFIWFLGSDEKIQKNAIKKIKAKLDKVHNVYILEGIINSKYRDGLVKKNDYSYLDLKNNLKEYIDDIKYDISYLFAFISLIVVRRQDYIDIEIPKELENSSYDHMYKMLKLASKNMNLKYIREIFYDAGINENDWNNKEGKHFLLDIDSLHKFIKNIYDNIEIETEIRKAVRDLLNRKNEKNGKTSIIFNIKYSKDSHQEDKLDEAIKYFYLYNFKYKFYKYFLSNNFGVFIINILRKIRKKLRK